jgi:hypothetical protein
MGRLSLTTDEGCRLAQRDAGRLGDHPVRQEKTPTLREAPQLEVTALLEDHLRRPEAELADHLGDEHLATLGTGSDAGGCVHRGAVAVAGLLGSHARVDSDPHPQSSFGVPPAVIRDAVLDREGAGDRFEGRGEGEHQPVAQRLDLAAAVRPHLLTDQFLVGAENRPGLTVTPGGVEGSRPLHVGEHDGDRGIGHAGSDLRHSTGNSEWNHTSERRRPHPSCVSTMVTVAAVRGRVTQSPAIGLNWNLAVKWEVPASPVAVPPGPIAV